MVVSQKKYFLANIVTFLVFQELLLLLFYLLSSLNRLW